MTTTAFKWSGLFSVGDELDDDDLLEADWIHVPESASGLPVASVPASLQEPGTSCNVQQGPVALQNGGSGLDSSAPVLLPEPRPVGALGSISTCGSTYGSTCGCPPGDAPITSHRDLLHGRSIPAALRPLPVLPQPIPSVGGAPRGDPPPPDDFDDWDVDLEELENVQRAGQGQAVLSDSISTAKRTRVEFCSAPRRPTPSPSFSTPRRAPAIPSRVGARPPTPPPSPGLPCGISALGRPLTLGSLGAPPPGQMGAVTPRLPRPHPASLFQAISPAPSSTLTPRPLDTPVLTNHLVQIVSAANKTPRRPRSEAVRAGARRFPGPAGALPQQLSGQSLNDVVVTVQQTPVHGAVARLRSEVPSSQVSEEDEFSGGVWAAMKAEMGLDERNPSCFLRCYSIVMVLRKAVLRQLPKNKVPNMAVVLKSIEHTHADGKAVFRDPTGEMQGTVHRRLLEDRQGDLKTGAVLLLKQVGVFSPSHRNHYLNVTPNNLLRIYPPDGAGHAPSQLTLPVLEPAGLLPRESSRPEGGPVSQMELHYEEEEETTVPANTTVPAQVPQACSEHAQWGADDLDELLWELPVDSYSV